MMLSFIIPAYNEEQNISITIEMIKKYVPTKYKYEVIVIDHGSTDNTFNLVLEGGAQVYRKNGGTVGNLRNYGVEKASGDIFIFLDADIHLTPEWSANIDSVIDALYNGERILTGSWVCVPENTSWIERNWFEPQQRNKNTHINSGHMIVSRENFKELGGFNGELETGEDYDISMRALKLNMKITDGHKLKVLHEGYPKNLWNFMKRELWHGKGDASSLRMLAGSKVAILSMVVLTLNIILLSGLLIFKNINLVYGAAVCIFCICILSSYVKFKREEISVLITNSFLYYFYFTARGCSVLFGLFSNKIQKRER